MKLNTTVRFTAEKRTRLSEYAQARSTNLSAVVDLATDRLLAEETILVELREMEDRLAATMLRTLRETARIGDDVQLVIAQVDQLLRFMFQATPEIFDKEAAAMVGSRRYTGFLESFAKEFVGRKRRAVFAGQMDNAQTSDDANDE
jgi:hypothetical protein